MWKDKGMGFVLLLLQLLSFVLLSFVDSGSAGVTSKFVRSEWPSTDIPLDNEAFVVPKGYNAPQQVHITQGDYDGKAVLISWVTVEAPGSNIVQYGTSENKYEFTASGTVTNYTFYNYTSGYIHHCLVDGLKYDTKYFYKVGDGDSARAFSFQTPPEVIWAKHIILFPLLSITCRAEDRQSYLLEIFHMLTDTSIMMLVFVGIHGAVLLNKVQRIIHGFGQPGIMK
ncbi:hypothetical protein CsSME_00051535 [Camellia sinensis var. sinensis]